MNFLPYASAGAGSWFAATGGAALAHGALLAVSLSSVQLLLEFTQPTLEAQPQYTITLERLDSDTIAGLLEQQGEAGSDGGEGQNPDAIEGEDDASEIEQIAALTPAEVDEPDPPEPEAVEAEDPKIPGLEDMVATTPEALTPETLDAVEAPVLAPVPEDTGPLISETVAALPLEQALTPVVPESTAGLLADPSAAGSQVLAPVTPSNTAVAAIRPTETPREPPAAAPPPTQQDLAIADLLRRIRAAPPEACLLALPRRDGEDGVGLALIGRSENAMARFAESVLTAEDGDIRQTRTLVDERQCAALGYIRENVDYPATRLGVRLDAAEVPSGGRLTGVLRGTAGRYVLLLLIDNNGVVQDLQRFMSFSGNFARFDVPVTRAGPPRDTKQVLLAVASRRPVNTLRSRSGQLSQDVFAGLGGELATRAALAVTTFDVR